MSGDPAHAGRRPPALRHRAFAVFAVVVLTMNLANQMIAVAIGWQVYDIQHRAFDLGLIGLLEFGPLLVLALPAGHLADRISRRAVLAAALVLLAAIAAALVVVSASGAHELWPFLLLAAANGTATALFSPATRALPLMLVPREVLPNAMAVRSLANQTGTVAGPALGGLLFAASPEVAYGAALGLFAVALAGTMAIRVPPGAATVIDRAPALRALLGGVVFIRHTPILLGAILLDLFAVLFGGAVALLPVFAQSILHTGPVGLGVLRSAPAAGAVIAGVLLVRRPLPGRTGRTLIGAFIAFGACMVVFGLSRSFPLSLAALAVSGGVDMVNMNIRTTTASMVTPDNLRGRVGAIESVFVGASNELGAFESGTAAALLGTVPSVVAGGALTIVIALAWTRLFPALAGLDRMADLRPPGYSRRRQSTSAVSEASAAVSASRTARPTSQESLNVDP